MLQTNFDESNFLMQIFKFMKDFSLLFIEIYIVVVLEGMSFF